MSCSTVTVFDGDAQKIQLHLQPLEGVPHTGNHSSLCYIKIKV